MSRVLRPLAIAFACSTLFVFTGAVSGEFTVNPIRMELGASARSGALTVRNDGKDKLLFQVEAMEWTQDSSGQDQYTQSRDLIFFPKLMALEGGKDGVVRVGTKSSALSTEKTYRLFIEELPASGKGAESKGVQLNVLVRFGAPIFVGPLKAQDSLEIEGPSLAKGLLSFSIRNTGNRHQVMQSIQVKGLDGQSNDVYALTLADRYLLAGTVKAYSASIPAERCSKMASLRVEIKTDKTAENRKLDVSRDMCP